VDGRGVPEGGSFMRITDLEFFGIPKVLIQSWQRNIGDELLPLQENAIRNYGLMEDRNLIISAPTSSGKTFCSELAMAKALTNGKKTVCLVPLKALAEERYRDFEEKYKPLGLKTIISTSDRRGFDKALENGDFNLAVVIFEKFNQILIRNLDILSFIDLIIVDEMQLIGDISRGPVLELALLKILRSKYNCRLIGLSAVLAGAEQLADWLDADLLPPGNRPVDLYQGVLWEGKYYYRDYNSGKTGVDQILEDSGLYPEEQFLAAARKLIDDDERLLIFLKSKLSCQQFAGLLSESVEIPTAEKTIDKLLTITKTGLTESLIDVLEKGIAFHHADLSYKQREIIESGYKDGEIRALFATTTLAMGLNLPATTVFLEPFRFHSGSYTPRAIPQHLDWPEYENMCGRAGRLKYANKAENAGKAIILVNTEFEKDVIWSKYMQGRASGLRGHLEEKTADNLVLELVASGCCDSHVKISNMLAGSFSGFVYNGDEIKIAIHECEKQKLIETHNNRLSVSALGAVVSSYGLSCQTASKLMSLLHEHFVAEISLWLYEFIDTMEMSIRSNIFIRGELETDPVKEITSHVNLDDCVPFRLIRILKNPELQDKANISGIAMVMALMEWCDGNDLFEIESKYHIAAGSLINSAEIAAWLSESVSGLARVMRQRRIRLFFKRMSFSLTNGLPFRIRPLWKMLHLILSREELFRVYTSGVHHPHALKKLKRADLTLIIGSEKTDKIMNLIEENNANNISKENNMNGSHEIKLVLEGKFNRDRLTVKFLGREFPLTMKSFKYLAKLACAKISDKSGWIHKESLEPGFNQARYIYNLKKELGLTKNQGLLENNRGGYYRLNILPENIALNLENLKSIQDYEIRSLAEEIEVSAMGS
jgi:ATP-dependent DNA helicase